MPLFPALRFAVPLQLAELFSAATPVLNAKMMQSGEVHKFKCERLVGF